MNKPIENPQSGAGDQSLRFLFEDADIRGETAHLNSAFRDIVSIHQYAPAVERLIGEFLAAAVMLSTTLKFEGRLILQEHILLKQEVLLLVAALRVIVLVQVLIVQVLLV